MVPATTKTTTVKQILTPTTKIPTIPTQTIQSTEMTENQELSTHPVRPVVKPNNQQRNVSLEPSQEVDRLPGTEDRKERLRFKEELFKTIQMKVLKLQPKTQTRNTTSSLRK